MTITGRFRLSFNRAGAAPLVWSVSPLDDEGRPIFELAVRCIGLNGVYVVTEYVPKPTPDAEDGQPSAYLLTRGTLTVDESGVVLIKSESA